MNLYHSIDELNKSLSGAIVIAIGNFDGCHKGHSDLLKRLIDKAKKSKAVAVVVSFNPHPLVYFGVGSSKLIDTQTEKYLKLEKLGVEHILEIEFNSNVQSLTAEEFINSYLLKIKRTTFIQLGHDFALGNGKEPAKDILIRLAPKTIEIAEVSSFQIEKITLSSTLIRNLITQGHMEEVNHYLGTSFSLTGKIVQGAGNGKKHLVPTANIKVSQHKIIPGLGVYFTTSSWKGKSFSSITNIGKNPTLGVENTISIESHLLDFESDIYGDELKVIFHKKCRDEMKFESLIDLKTEINRNIKSRREFQC